ncbi:hypothetical protein Scep_029655 [Stephania cephalantha]|uniref:RecF/RecN/SMC N-terminal domain-containing protein n=1 Tax=Stephania cephalantha TaxID=152367 RepID=A0AAP0E5R6_9MAGN
MNSSLPPTDASVGTEWLVSTESSVGTKAVDAALDLSHTQNIGRMIKTHFPHSQFIVVSLKEGMFNNANVLFRTKFVDGVSTVQRTIASKHNR